MNYRVTVEGNPVMKAARLLAIAGVGSVAQRERPSWLEARLTAADPDEAIGRVQSVLNGEPFEIAGARVDRP
jgi:hypothetical protein